MKKVKLLIILLICLFIANVKADMGAPSVVQHEVMVTNKSGAVCYEDGKKTNNIIPYGTTLKVYDDIHESYIYVTSDQYNCNVKYSDVSAKNQNFNINSENSYKLNPTMKAIILAQGGLNMRKGPAVTYGKITTVPQYSIVKLEYSSGSYWYYTTYNGKSGWITGMNGYIGYDSKEVLIHYEPVKIYSANGKTVLGTIPANTEIDEYIELSGAPYNDNYHYVIYKGIKGYIHISMGYKINGTGKIKLNKDYTIYDEEGNPSKKISAGQELEYTIQYGKGEGVPGLYVPDKKLIIYPEEFDYIKKAELVTKTKGYIGEGLFGEAKETKAETPTEPGVKVDEPAIDEPVITKEENKMNSKDIIIIGLLAGIFAALMALVIIKLVNSKKKPVVKEMVKEEKNKEDKSITVPDKDIVKAREEIIKKIDEEKKESDNNKEV